MQLGSRYLSAGRSYARRSHCGTGIGRDRFGVSSFTAARSHSQPCLGWSLGPTSKEDTMLRLLLILSFVLISASGRAGEVERLFVIDCGFAHAEDQSLWSPGVNVGVPIDFSDNCYLIRHSSEGYLLWDTGITDRLVALPQGQAVPPLRQTWYHYKSLVATLADIGLKPADVRYVAISHIHPDHIGNVDTFPDSALIMQRGEWEAAM